MNYPDCVEAFKLTKKTGNIKYVHILLMVLLQEMAEQQKPHPLQS